MSVLASLRGVGATRPPTLKGSNDRRGTTLAAEYPNSVDERTRVTPGVGATRHPTLKGSNDRRGTTLAAEYPNSSADQPACRQSCRGCKSLRRSPSLLIMD